MIRPEIGLSDIYLNLSVETGTSYEGSFIIYSQNGQELSGKVLSTNDKVVVKVTELSGIECEIPFYFKGKMAIPGEEHFGDFLLLTNGGEFNLPYCVTVVPKKYWFGDRAISDLNDFSRLAKEDWKKAKDIFFTKEFPDIVLGEQEEYRLLYHDLLKGYSKDAILDHFLMETVGKKPVRIFTDKKEIRIDETKVGRFVIKKEGWGSLDVRVYGEEGGLMVSRERIVQEDFEENKLDLFVSLKEGWEKDVLVLDTVFSRIRIPVGRKREIEKNLKSQEKKNRDFSCLLRYYVDFRTGKISPEEYIEYSLKSLPVNGHFYELYCFLLLLIRVQTEEAGMEECSDYGRKIEAKQEEYIKDSRCKNFYLYVMALWKKEKAVTKQSACQIRADFEKEGKLTDYILLLMLDEKIAFWYKEQWETLHSFLEQGENSPLLYLALLDVLNQEPYLLEQLDEKKTAVIGWGLRHQYLSQKLIEQFARLSMKEKSFKKNQLPILLNIYEKKRDELYLKAICSMLMKGNKTELTYHRYFADAANRQLNLVGLNEFYLRTLDMDTYPVLPKLVLYYFHYSNSLDKRERAWLYLNILLHEEEYEDIYRNYYDRIKDFVKEQLMEGKMNRYLKQLYESLLPVLLEDNELAKYLPNIIFRKKMVCHNPMMEGIFVCHPENEDEIYIPFVDGCCQLEIYSDVARIYFVDRMGNRYHTGIPYSMESYLNEEAFRDYCLENVRDNRKVLTKWSYMEDKDKKEQLARLLIENDEAKSWKREKAVEQILDYHYEEKMLEDLSECLDQINYRIISPSYRRTLMNYYMTCNRMEDAYFGVELYGSDLMDPNQLYLLTCVGLYLHKEERDELLLIMAHRTFVNRRYNKEVLVYLREYFEGRVFDFLDIWTVLKQEGLETAAYEERVLNQILFTGAKDETMLDVLLSYLNKAENDTLTDSMLEIYSTYYLCNGLKNSGVRKTRVPESYFAILDKQVGKNRPLTITSRLAYLLKKSETGCTQEEKSCIRSMISDLCREQIVFPFYEKFDSFTVIPSLWKESVCFWFLGEEGREYKAAVLLEDGNRKRLAEVLMKEIIPGFYYGSLYMPGYERILETKVSGFEGSLNVAQIGHPVLGSRNQLLSRMEEERNISGAWMKEYETMMGRMTKQLKFLGEW